MLLFPGASPTACEFAYAVGAAYRGQGLAARAITALLPTARAAGYRCATLTIAQGNVASERVAAAAGFQRDSAPLTRRERKGYTLPMGTWSRAL